MVDASSGFSRRCSLGNPPETHIAVALTRAAYSGALELGNPPRSNVPRHRWPLPRRHVVAASTDPQTRWSLRPESLRPAAPREQRVINAFSGNTAHQTVPHISRYRARRDRRSFVHVSPCIFVSIRQYRNSCGHYAWRKASRTSTQHTDRSPPLETHTPSIIVVFYEPLCGSQFSTSKRKLWTVAPVEDTSSNGAKTPECRSRYIAVLRAKATRKCMQGDLRKLLAILYGVHSLPSNGVGTRRHRASANICAGRKRAFGKRTLAIDAPADHTLCRRETPSHFRKSVPCCTVHRPVNALWVVIPLYRCLA